MVGTMGGARPGAGRPKGSKSRLTIEKDKILEEFKDKVAQAAKALFTAQMTLATGRTYLYRIDKVPEAYDNDGNPTRWKNKKPVLVTNQEEIEGYLSGRAERGDMEDCYDPASAYYFITTKDPDNKAIDSLLDRTFGKAVNNIDANISGNVTLADIVSELDEEDGGSMK